jgi:16S rRNA (guanine527-N7)-methyltransferase
MEIILKYFSEFTPRQIQQLEALGPLYKEWNNKINVISRKDIDYLYERHVLHSLSIAAVFEFTKAMEIADLGTGGGFPGIPLAIFFPDTQFHLVDSIGKKLKVVEAIAANIGLKNVTTRHSRIEDIKNIKFDFVVSRAVAPLKDLWKWSKPLLKKQPALPDSSEPGLICLKGGDLNNEIHESETKPVFIEIKNLFDEEFFRDKCILYVKK